MHRAKKITIHPLYVKEKRDQNDIALLETEESFNFSLQDKISPICLPSKNLTAFSTMSESFSVIEVIFFYLNVNFNIYLI